MSRATYTFHEGGQRRYLTISNHGYYVVFDAALRDQATHAFTITVRGRFGGKTKANDDYLKTIIYRGSCKRGVVDDLTLGELEKKAARLFATYQRTMRRRAQTQKKGGESPC